MIKTSVLQLASFAQKHALDFRWAYVAVFLGLQVLVQYPIWNSVVPVLSDYPNHLARMYILHDAGRSAVLNQFYEIHWGLLPNLAMDMIVPSLIGWFGLEIAGKLFLAMILLLISSGTIVLHRMLHGYFSFWPFMVFLFLYNQTFITGVVNYLFGVGVALWMMAFWVNLHPCSMPSDVSGALMLPYASDLSGKKYNRLHFGCYLAISIAAIFLFLCHLSAFCLYAIVVLAYEIARSRVTGEHQLPWLKLANVVATLITPVLIFVLISPIGQGEGQGFNWKGFPIPVFLGAMFGTKLFAPLVPVGNYVLELDYFTVAILGVLLIRSYFVKVLDIERSMIMPLAAVALAFLLTPPELYKSAMADFRLVPAWVFLFLASVDMKSIERRISIGVFFLLLCLLIVRMGVVVHYWNAQDKITVSYLKAIGQLPVGVRLYTAYPEQEYSDDLGAFKTYLPCLGIAVRSIFIPSLYSLRGGQPVWLTPTFQSLKKRSLGPLFSSGKDPNWKKIVQDYDYLLVADQARFTLLPLTRLQSMASGPDFTLYRVLKKH